jgi:5-methylcytosine-specific restriction endonuclease McrA
MPWDNSPAKRRRDAAIYADPIYQRNRQAALRRAGGACEETAEGRRCGSRDRVQVDHISNVAATGHADHSLGNLQVLCKRHHDVKTSREGHAARRDRQADPEPAPRTKWA